MLRLATQHSTTTSSNNALASLCCCALPSLVTASRFVRYFDQKPRKHKRTVTHLTLNTHHSSYFGGRVANFRYPGKSPTKKAGAQWKNHHPTTQYNIDVWAAQQTLRRKWKGRDWRVVEVPYESAPKPLQRVIPELYTELPQMTSPSEGDYSNIRAKTFPQEEELQQVLFGNDNVLPKPVQRGNSSLTLDSFFSS